jgi:hypothetical protein
MARGITGFPAVMDSNRFNERIQVVKKICGPERIGIISYTNSK